MSVEFDGLSSLRAGQSTWSARALFSQIRRSGGAVGFLSRSVAGAAAVLDQFLDAGTKAGAKDDPLTNARHRSFIFSHGAAAMSACVAFCAYFATIGPMTAYALIAWVLFAIPLAVAIGVARTGRLELAHLLSASGLVGLVIFVALLSGGIGSFAIVWMAIVPLEAALSGSRYVVIRASFVALLGLAGIAAATILGLALPIEADLSQGAWISQDFRTGFSHLAAALYACALALKFQAQSRHSENAIRASREDYQLLAENATDLITRHDAAGNVIFASPASRQMLGAGPETLTGSGYLERVVMEDRPRFINALSQARRTGEVTEEEFRLRREGAHATKSDVIWVEMRCRPVMSPPLAGSARASRRNVSRPGDGLEEEVISVHAIAVTRDISLRKSQELELIAARNLAEQSSRAKTMMLAHMSHELRTPLNAILGFSDLLSADLAQVRAPGRALDHCQIIHDSGEHLLSLVNDLLDVSKIESGNYKIVTEPFFVHRLVEGCCQTVMPAAHAKSLAVTWTLEPKLPEIEADRRALKQILLNLLSNAVKFTPVGGRVDVDIRADATHMTFHVRDSGIGIAAEDIPKLGQPFIQVEQSYARRTDGTGLGLSIVTGLARLHGGSMTIESALTKGTTVTVTLPLSGMSCQGQADGPLRASPGCESGLKPATPVATPAKIDPAISQLRANGAGLMPGLSVCEHALYVPPADRIVALPIQGAPTLAASSPTA